jgi:hypothetical protein
MGAPSPPGFNLDQTFFGFKPEDRVQLHESLFNLVWHGNGKWTWSDLYHMPIFLRKFWIQKLNKIYEEATQREEQRKAANSVKKNKVVKSPL